MTVSTETASISYAGNGATTVFSVPFYFLENSHIRVVLRTSAGVESTKILTTDYTVANAGTNPSTATVTCVSFTPASGQTLRIVRDPPLTQETDYVENDPFPAETHEEALDKLTMIAQAISSDVSRALKLPETSTASADLPEPSGNGNRFLALNSGATAFTYADSGSGSLTNVDYKFASVAAMSGQTGMANNAIALTYGYYTANDGGHGTYRYDSASAAAVNGGTVINAAGGVGRWLLLRDYWVDVRQFGAKGDGVTNDTTAIKAAIANVDYITVSKGTYIVDESLNLRSGVVIIGTGKGSLFDMSTDDDGHLIGIVGATLNPVVDCIVSNIALDCNNVINLNGVGIAYATRNFVKNVWVFNAGRKAFTLQYEVFDNIISDCYGEGGEATFGLITLEDPTFTNQCQRNIINNISSDTATDYVIAITGAENNCITNVTSEASLRGILLERSSNNTIQNIKLKCTNSVLTINGSSDNTLASVHCDTHTTNPIMTVGTYAASERNVFDSWDISSTKELLTYNAFFRNNEIVSSRFVSTLSTSQFVGLAASSNGNKFIGGYYENGGNRLFIVDSNDTRIDGATLVAPLTAINMSGARTTITNNTMQSVTSFAIEGASATDSIVCNNTANAGTVNIGVRGTEWGNSWNPSVRWGTAAPVAGTWNQGSVVYNTATAAGGTPGWVCTTGGTPGTWKAMANVAP